MDEKNKNLQELEQENMELRKKLSDIEKVSEILNQQKDDQNLFRESYDRGGRDHMYRILIENMNEGALVMNQQSMIVYSNKRFADFTGFPLQKVIGADFESFIIDEDLIVFSEILSLARTEKSFCEVRLKKYKPGYISVLASITSLLLGDEIYYCLIMTDFSSHKEVREDLKYKVEERSYKLAVANKRLKTINNQLNNVNKYLDNFVHALAHDMRTPVANLKLIQQMFRMAPEEQKEKLMEAVDLNINKLDNTLKGLVQIIDTQGKQEKIKKNIVVQSLVNEILEEEKEKIQNTGADIQVRIDPDQKINYVEGYLASIVRNLLSNSLKYRKPDIPLKVRINADKNHDYHILTFADNGIGIDLEKGAEKLFMPFQRFSSRSKGMGIGLHIINNMVRKNGGYINVQSTPGEGTEFIVHLKEYTL